MNSRRQAFTLLEMLLVVFILAALAATTSSMIDDAHDQARVDDTRNRLDLIRTAISGSDDVRSPITGFVADMGRLPVSIRELLEDVSVPPTPYDVDPTGVGSGWRGPYLRTLPGSSGRPELWDGFGNLNPDLALVDQPADPNFGWVFDAFDVNGDPHPVLAAFTHLQLDVGDVRVASRGGDAALTVKDAENAIKIDQTEHHVDVGSWKDVQVTFEVIGPLPATARGLALRIWEPDGAGGVVGRTGDLSGTANDFVSVPSPGGPSTVLLRFRTNGTAETWVSHGVRAIELCYLDTNNTAQMDDDTAQPLTPPQFLLIELRARAPLPVELRRTFAIGSTTP